jgi:hypothetical protein
VPADALDGLREVMAELLHASGDHAHP